MAYSCEECEERADAPMLKDEIWDKVSHTHNLSLPINLLCIKCIEKSLGRRLKLDDLKPCVLTTTILKMVERSK